MEHMQPPQVLEHLNGDKWEQSKCDILQEI